MRRTCRCAIPMRGNGAACSGVNNEPAWAVGSTTQRFSPGRHRGRLAEFSSLEPGVGTLLDTDGDQVGGAAEASKLALSSVLAPAPEVRMASPQQQQPMLSGVEGSRCGTAIVPHSAAASATARRQPPDWQPVWRPHLPQVL